MSNLSKIKSFCCAALFAASTPACLDPLVSDEVDDPGLILPAGTEVPSAHSVPEIEAQLTANDGVEALVPRLSGFAQGARVHYWDFGSAPAFSAPIFVVMERDEAGELQRTPHPTIIDSIPGQVGYSPFWSLLILEVEEAYQGELITSFPAIEEAQRLGLVKAPVIADIAINCPIVAAGVSIEVGGGVEAIEAKADFFWRGMIVSGFDLGQMAVERSTVVTPAPMYVLSREGGEPLSEPERGVDITGDGDIQDSNNIFPNIPSDAAFSTLCQRVEVTVPSDIAQTLIDDTLDETSSGLSRATDLFNPDPVAGTVVAFEETDQFINCPQQMTEGSL